MRILLLRLLVCSWAVPVTWLLMLPMFYLMSGNWDQELDAVMSLTRDLWNGNA